jgi:putative sterol carrier protein
MNVLVINGSPKANDSNSMKLTRAFLDGTGYDAEVINVSKLKITPCLGCFSCWDKTPGKCVINDDMAGVLDKIIAAGAEFCAGGITLETQTELAEPMYAREVFEKMANASWSVSENGEATEDDGFDFTKRMAATYRPDGKERVIEFAYTDIGKTYQIVCLADGHSVIREDFKPYATRIETPYAVWRAIARGELSGQEAMFQKKYRVSGDFGLMLQWNELFGGETSAPPRQKDGKSLKTNMTALIAPWMVIWIALSIDPVVGGTLGILSATAVPLIWLAFKPTPFERITVFAVAALSLAALVGADTRLVVPISYGLFGIMWFGSAFREVPLTAYYSRNAYGGDKALENPLFMRVNRVLTAFRGVLYLLTPFWTYAMMGTAAAGVFTAWFQKWYPAQWAKG